MNNLTETEGIQAQSEPELERLEEKLKQIEEDIDYAEREGEHTQATELKANRLELLDTMDREKGLYNSPLGEIEE